MNPTVKKLRRALVDGADNSLSIETFPRRGYRFIAPVSSNSLSPISVTVSTHLVSPLVHASPAYAPNRLEAKVTRRFGGSRGIVMTVLAGAVVCTAAAGLAAWYWPKPSKVPHLVRITQLTRSGYVHGNQNLATDGLRLYNIDRETGDWARKSMPAAGGPGTRVDVPLSRYDLQDLSPDGSEMLLRRITADAEDASVWIMSSVGGSIHRMGEIHALAAAFTTDGRSITYSNGADVYLCDKDGSNSRKLFSATGEVLRMRWSPRGDLLRFTLNDPSGHANSLWEVRSDGSQLRPVLPGWNLPKWEWAMGW